MLHGGVLDLRLYSLSPSSLVFEPEGGRFRCTRCNFFFKSSISCCRALWSFHLRDARPFPLERLLLVWEVFTLPSRCLSWSLPVWGSKSCLAVGSLRVPYGAGLILPLLTVSHVKAWVLPTDGANCKDSIRGLGPTIMGFWAKEPWTMNL